MIKIFKGIVVFFSLFVLPKTLLSQEKIFEKIKVPDSIPIEDNGILGINQDHLGYIWFTVNNYGLVQYDGSRFRSYVHQEANSKSISLGNYESLAVDRDDAIWIATWGNGLNRFNPLDHSFTHFKHNSKDSKSISQDTVNVVYLDHKNQIWIGTNGGLDLYDPKTNGFKHFKKDPKDVYSLSSNHVRSIYEDRKGVLWIGCGFSFDPGTGESEDGGLNRMDSRTGRFTWFLHDPKNPGSISNNRVRAMLEDQSGNFWVGTSGNGLQSLNRSTGLFTHYIYDSIHPEKLSGGPVLNHGNYKNREHISFIKQDVNGKIWIGTFLQGIIEYDPNTQRVRHHGIFLKSTNPFREDEKDTITGIHVTTFWNAFSDSNGILWITNNDGVILKMNPWKRSKLPFFHLQNTRNQGANAFYKEENGSLWIGSFGLIHKDKSRQINKVYLPCSENSSSSNENIINALKPDKNGSLWVGSAGGLSRFNLQKKKFYPWPDTGIAGNLHRDEITYIYIDNSKNIWVGTYIDGVFKINLQSGHNQHFKYSDTYAGSRASNSIYCITEDSLNIWVSTQNGIERINKGTNEIFPYLKGKTTKSVFVDEQKKIWVGSNDGLYVFNQEKNNFIPIKNNLGITQILSIQEDLDHYLWINTQKGIYKIDPKREISRIFTDNPTNKTSIYGGINDYRSNDGEFYFGSQFGYYSFYPREIGLDPKNLSPIIYFTGLDISGKTEIPGTGGVLKDRLEKTKKISLSHDQNSITVHFSSLHFQNPGEEKYLYQLFPYDKVWQDPGDSEKISFFALPPGEFILKLRAFNPDGTWAEKALSIDISSPWWQTTWFLILLLMALITSVWAFIQFRSRQLILQNKILEQKVQNRTEQLQKSYQDLKSTQNQLIHSEKMASLGELVAGIAHEIQNPLNFVNNFSGLNLELIDESIKAMDDGDPDDANELLKTIKSNEMKIIHHGQRADSIVKSMLQHSRKTSSETELVDLNRLADEFISLSYQGIRAKDKSFHAELETQLDSSSPKIIAVQQELGRVILNLFNNAFYAVNERRKESGKEYKALVKVMTQKGQDKVEIKIFDNGKGIPPENIEKIFQPFFTTKPTGEGTGLGLSLSYDIIKAHGGEIRVESRLGEYTEFIVSLPYKPLYYK